MATVTASRRIKRKPRRGATVDTLPRHRLLRVIAATGLTTPGFAARCGVEAAMLAAAVRGTGSLTRRDLDKVAELAGTTADWLLTGNGELPKTRRIAPHQSGRGSGRTRVAKVAARDTRQITTTVAIVTEVVNLVCGDGYVRELMVPVANLHDATLTQAAERGEDVTVNAADVVVVLTHLSTARTATTSNAVTTLAKLLQAADRS